MPNVNNLSYSSNGLELTEKSESLRTTAYQDSVGVWTIGYGHTGPDVHPGLTITPEQATALLMKDVAGACASVNSLVTVQLNQNQFDALVDFVFNMGAGSFKTSTLLRELNAGNFDAAAAEFPKWCHAGGQVLQGLVTRRAAEQELFQTPEAAAAAGQSA